MNVAILFCLSISTLVCLFAKPLMQIFIEADQTEIIRIGVEYLHIEGAFYVGIGLLFLFYGYYRAMNRPGVSVVLTVISLGTRVVLAHILSAIPVIGVPMITMMKATKMRWWSWIIMLSSIVLVCVLKVSPIYILICVIVMAAFIICGIITTAMLKISDDLMEMLYIHSDFVANLR